MRNILLLMLLLLLISCTAENIVVTRSDSVPRQCFDLPVMLLSFHPEEGQRRSFSVDEDEITLSDYDIGAGAPAEHHSYNFITGNVTKYRYPGGALQPKYGNRTIYEPGTQGFIKNLDYIKGHVKNYIIINGEKDPYTENLTIILKCLDKVYKAPQ